MHDPHRKLVMSRRGVLGAVSTGVGLVGLGGLGLPVRPSLAKSLSGGDLKFIFVVNYGGWDPTRVFASEFSNAFVDMERDAEEATIGDLTFVDHENRPNVRSFLENHSAETLFLNGILVSSIAHENCLRIQLTGSTAQDRSDWGAILAGCQAEGFALPQVVIGGPSFPGEFGAFVTRTGTEGQLDDLLSGDIIGWSDDPVEAPDWRAEARMDQFMAARGAAVADQAGKGGAGDLRRSWDTAIERARFLKDLQQDVDFSGATTFGGQAELAVELLSRGVSRVATLNFDYYGWDTHASNDSYQSTNFNMLFSELSDLMTMLQSKSGSVMPTLAEETVLVVLSEMGRTPQLNSLDGKDHWPYTCAMVTGPGITGGRVVGGFDESYYGLTIDPDSGEVAEEATNLSSDVLGATLLTLADIDSEEFASGISPITGVLT